MAATAFLSAAEIDQPPSSPKAQKLLDEVRQITGRNWQLVEYGFFRTVRKNIVFAERVPYFR